MALEGGVPSTRVSAVVPHAGYSQTPYHKCMDALRNAFVDAGKTGFKCMVGGDFNTGLYRGWRDYRLEELCCGSLLTVCNDPTDLGPDVAWTFKSALGHQRTLDNCLVDDSVHCRSSYSGIDCQTTGQCRLAWNCRAEKRSRR